MGLSVDPRFWEGRRVLVTGHTGFKGGWLTLWLASMGARVSGVALAPSPGPSLFGLTRLADLCDSRLVDIRDAALLHSTVVSLAPEVVFHCAAQPLVRLSYAQGAETWMTNVMGTIHLLDALRAVAGVRAIVAVTSDKCYENREGGQAFREDDPLGGLDPYSSSKAGAELAVASWRHAFFAARAVGVASARAGNVIGGGDWAADRLIPDLVGGFLKGEAVLIRHPHAVRPWQHVLEPLAGYLLLAQRLVDAPAAVAGAWNFGPDEAAVTVAAIADRIAARFGPSACWRTEVGDHPHEAGLLALDSGKARGELGWRPRWNVDAALDATISWYQAWNRGNVDMQSYTLEQIKAYLSPQAT